MTAEALLQVDDLRVSFGKPGHRATVVKGVSFSVHRGETVAIVGESGSGKSVSSLAVIGLLGKGRQSRNELVEGRIRFSRRNGERQDLVLLDRAAMREVQGEEIAMIFQEPMTSLNPVLKVGEQIAEALLAHKDINKAAAWQAAEGLLTQVGIPDARRWLQNYPHQMSGGMRQRVMIAIALSCKPALLIADEPTTALDVTIQAQILDLIAELKQASGSAVLFITHDLGVVSEIADRVVVMYAGFVVEEGAVADVIGSPLHPYTRGLIECVPRIAIDDEPLQDLRPIPGTVADPAAPPPGCPFHPRCAFALPGICDQQVPPLEMALPGRQVRCVRWRELPGAGQ